VGQTVAPVDDLLERGVLAAQRLLLGGLGHHLAQLGVLARLGDEVVGAQPHGLHGRLDVGVAGEDDQLGVDLGAAGPAEDLEAGVIGQLHVDDGDVELFGAESSHALGARARFDDAGSGVALQHGGQQSPDVGVVVDDEHAHHVRHLA
jgi:hypothetical protein